jgi:hypothetical protein
MPRGPEGVPMPPPHLAPMPPWDGFHSVNQEEGWQKKRQQTFW